jgi:hypothetical protein
MAYSSPEGIELGKGSRFISSELSINKEKVLSIKHKETLEEAAEKMYQTQKLNTYTPYSFKDAFKDGAKWQQERSYSEEDMVRFANLYSNLDIDELHLKYFNNLPRFKNK